MSSKSSKSSVDRKNKIENAYQKKDPREHILLRPDTYIGSTKIVEEEMWVYNQEQNKMEKKMIKFSWALYNILDEILVNAMDHSTKTKIPMKSIKITVDTQKDEISVWNDGDGIPILKHSQYNLYVPELIFGELLSGSNFNDSEQRFTGGRNGYGAKLTNIYSKHFIIETVDSKSGLKYKQKWSNNMAKKSEPVIKKVPKKSRSYTKITFKPDLTRFHTSSLNTDIFSLFQKRAFDVSACTRKTISVEFNGKKLSVKDFSNYIDLYIGDKEQTPRVLMTKKDPSNENFIWELGVSNSADKFQQISFVNGIATEKGGRHVDYIVNQITKGIVESIKKKNKNINLKPAFIKDRLFIFLRSTIINPAFSSQTKEELTTPSKDFGFTFELDSKFIDKIAKLGIADEAISMAKYKESREMAKKTDGKKSSKIVGIPKLDDANYAGTAKSGECTLILTEGDSAKAFASNGISAIPNARNYYGIFPLKGKLLNVREASVSKASQNDEIMNLKKILGLQQGKKYKDTSDLRYSSILILTDQDLDGSHIKGLLMNMVHYWFPELLGLDFIRSLATPIIKVTPGKNKQPIEFFTLSEYDDYKSKFTGGVLPMNYSIKYYKGLGTSSAKEAKESFKDINQKQIIYKTDSQTDQSVKLAFEKKLADKRKEWLQNYNKNLILEQSQKKPSFTEFIQKDLVHFSVYDTARSIPSICDGLKPSQRKVLFGCFKRNLVSEIKVAQLAGYISEHSAYHHGEASLHETIIKMAQDFVGSNNINLLSPNGQFGTRAKGGKDSASPRYIFTQLEPITKMLFDPRDNGLLNYLDDDGKSIEPDWYLPIIPMVLINGASGIGTGYSTDIPCYNPKDIIEYLKNKLESKSTKRKKLIPYYRYFKGQIKDTETEGVFSTQGIYEKDNSNDKKIIIKELPIGVWTENYKKTLDDLISNGKYGLVSKLEKHRDQDIHFELVFKDSQSVSNLLKNKDTFEKNFKLKNVINTSNMYLFNKDLQIRKYNTPEQIIDDFYTLRLYYYQLRKDYLINELEAQIFEVNQRIMFIEMIIEGKIKVFRVPKKQIEEQLKQFKFEPSPKTNDYSHLLSMPIYSFTQEKIEELKKKEKEMLFQLETVKSKTNKQLWMDDLEVVSKTI